jgi:hypothetical protein
MHLFIENASNIFRTDVAGPGLTAISLLVTCRSINILDDETFLKNYKHHYKAGYCDTWTVSRKRFGKFVTAERLILRSRLVTEHGFRGHGD